MQTDSETSSHLFYRACLFSQPISNVTPFIKTLFTQFHVPAIVIVSVGESFHLPRFHVLICYDFAIMTLGDK